MTFEFLVRCHINGESDLQADLTDLLRDTLQENLNEFDDDAVNSMIVLRQRRKGDEHQDETGNKFRHELVTFRLDLPDETESVPAVLEEFTDALPGSPSIVHVVRF